jgi:penicillin-binding protein 1C
LHGQGPFDIGFPVAVKTGTSSGYRDTWSVGYTRERTVAVWLGNAAGAPTLGLTGATGAGPLFADVMRRAMADVPGRAPLWDADLLDEAEVCPLSGRPVGPACPGHATRRFLHGQVPPASCDLHVAAAPIARAASVRAPVRCDAGGPLRIVALPAAYDEWLATKPPGAPGQDPFGIPWYPRSALSGCGDAPQRAAEIRVEAPAPGSVFPRSLRGDDAAEAIEVSASFVGDAITARRLVEVEFVVDGRVAARSTRPFRAALPAVPGDHDLVVRPADPALAVRLGTSRFSVR